MLSIREKALVEILQRGQVHAKQSRLIVDFYRIRRRLAYPLPIRECEFPSFPTRLGTWYPWDCWLAWAIEERIYGLGWAITLGKETSFCGLAEADLQGLAAWKYDDLEKTDGLAVAHFVRTMCAANQHWLWLNSITRSAIAEGLSYLLQRFAKWLEAEREWWRRRNSTPEHPDFANPLHNIHFIQTVGLCLAARATMHASSEWLEAHVQQFALAVLNQHASGISEGTSYDGYVLDFLMDWASGAPAALRETILSHPELQSILEQPAIVGAPGNLIQTAPLGDVEALEMPFHASALAKWRCLQQSVRHDWQLSQFDPGTLRTDALAAIVTGPELALESVPPDQSRTRAAIALRSGNTLTDMAVAMSAHAAPMGHLHYDNGSIVIAVGGQWVINDPGYQQYMSTAERDFSIGPAAHNAPVLNGCPQTKRAGRVISAPALTDGIWHAANDLRGCYNLPLTQCSRDLWLSGNKLVIIADKIAGADLNEIAYHWHGHPQAAWWVEEGIALVCLEDAQLWVRCMNTTLDASLVDRLKGSRGHLTLRVRIKGEPHQIIWWVFGTDKASLRAFEIKGDELHGCGLRCTTTAVS